VWKLELKQIGSDAFRLRLDFQTIATHIFSYVETYLFVFRQIFTLKCIVSPHHHHHHKTQDDAATACAKPGICQGVCGGFFQRNPSRPAWNFFTGHL
jgi:hypothetical protein